MTEQSTLAGGPVADLALLANSHYLDIAVDNLFTVDECERIVSLLEPELWRYAEVQSYTADAHEGRIDPTTRSVRQQQVPVDGTGWIYRRLSEHLSVINSEVFRFDLAPLAVHDSPNVLWYEASENDHFRPHNDAGQRFSTRKLSYSVQLSDPATYVGGDLVFFPEGNLASQDQGAVTVFPSFLHHSVTPVMSGARYALVGWLHGPTFR